MNYTVIKSKRSKYSRVRIKPTGEVVLTVPYYFSSADIDKTILKFMPWINKHLESATDVSLKKDIKDLGYIYILGNKTTIRLIKNNINLITLEDELIINYTTESKINKLINDFLDGLRKRITAEILEKYKKYQFFKVDELIFKDLKRTYGICYKDKRRIILAKTNIHKRYEFNEAVIAHELTHLVESNHKKGFYELLLSIYPNYKEEIKKKVN